MLDSVSDGIISIDEEGVVTTINQIAKEIFSTGHVDDLVGKNIDELDLPEGAGFLNMLRVKTMKQGGVGYVQPGRGSFPQLAETNRFIASVGAIPTHTWNNGMSDGEQAIEELLHLSGLL